MHLDYNLIDHLKTRLSDPLPGKEVQYEMAPLVKHAYHDIPSQYKTASVLALIYPKESSWHIALMKRKNNRENDQHAGQISFPGGQLEEHDLSLEDCAIRETREEIGLTANDVTILGGLTNIYVYVSQFLVYPFIGMVNHTPQFKAQISEVDKILEVPIRYLLDPSIKKRKTLTVRGVNLKDVPYFDVYGETLWGATAMIMNEFLYVLDEYKKPKLLIHS